MGISVGEFIKLTNVNVVDLRGIEKFNSSHIPGAINIPFEHLLLKPSDYISKDLKYYLYCQHGLTSKSVCGVLTRLGFNVVNLDGGFEEWLLSNG